jgi:type I restriction enzyme, S subunit
LPSKLAQKQLRAGDILIEASGGSPAKPVGRSALVESEQADVPATCSNFFRVLRPNKNKADARFLNHKLVWRYRQPEMMFFQQQTTGIINLKMRDFLAAPLSVPRETIEQSKISEVLDTLDTAIRGTETVVAKLKAMKQGLLHDLLTRGIDANGDLRPPHTEAPHLYKETPLGWLPKEWDETTLGEIAEVDRGQFTHRPRNDPAYYGGRFPFIQTGDVAAAKGVFVTLSSQTLNAKGARVSREFPAGTIAITIAANIADTGILAVPMYFPDSVVGAVVNDGVNIRFVELWVRRAKRLLDARAPQSAQKNINLQDLRPLEVFLPEKDEQDEIGLRYDALFAKLNSEQKLLAKLRAQKSGLMDDLLTGRVSVSPLLEGEAAHGA